MKKIIAISRLELFFSLKRSGFSIYYIVLFSLTFLFVNVMGGAFPTLQVMSDNVKINAPVLLQMMIGSICLLTTFVVSSFSGMGALRDYNYQSYQITFTYPLSEWQFIIGKFLGIYLVNMLLFTAPLLGHAVGCEMPWLVRSAFLPFNFLSYWHIYIQLIAVNIFFLTAIFFVLGLLLRNIVVNWMAIISFYILYFLAQKYFSQAATKTLGILLDPYGLIGTLSVSIGQGAQERNSHAVHATGFYLYNRLIWIAIGILFLAFAWAMFRFAYQSETLRIRWFKQTAKKKIAEPGVVQQASPLFSLNYGWLFVIKTFWSQLAIEARQTFKNIYFYLILIASLVFLYFSSQVVGKIFETPAYPTTKQVLDVLSGSINIFIMLLLLVFSGETVWRDAMVKLDGIIGSVPASRQMRYAAKTTILYVIVVIMLSVVMVFGLLFQRFHDYHNYEVSLYLRYLFCYLSIKYLFYCILAVALQTLTRNRFQGYAAFVLIYVFNTYFATALLRHGVFIPGFAPGVSYSDLTGFDGSFYTFYIYSIYWMAFALLIWRAGQRSFLETEGDSFKIRLKKLFSNGWLKHKPITWVFLMIFVGLGVFIFYNTCILHKSLTEKEENKAAANYEKRYSRLKSKPQLVISNIEGIIDLLPSKREIQAGLKLTLVNKANDPISDIYLNLPHNRTITKLKFDHQWKQVFSDKKHRFYGYHLSVPLQPGDSVLLSYHFGDKPNGFTDQGVSSLVNYNGTFLNSTSFMPVIGYDKDKELESKVLRKEFGLPAKPYAPLLSDSAAKQQSMFGQSADRVGLKLTIGTDTDQIAIAPGYLKHQWKQGRRAYYVYEMDKPAINYFNIQSGHYKMQTESYVPPGDSLHRPIQLSIYYYATHNYNLDVMMTGMKDAINHYTRIYGPYQYHQLRIVEFPQGNFAQSFANTIAFSENIGFITDLRKFRADDDADRRANYAYFVTVHEVAHQWWAHQLLPAGVEGSQFLSESLSQYSAIMTVKEKYGEAGARKFLEHYSFDYLNERGAEKQEERPLETVLGGQQYIFYNKGICEMYALQSYLGEEKFNHTLKSFFTKNANKERPYVTSDMLINELKAATPDSMQYLIDDCLKKIIIYDDKILDVRYKRDTASMLYSVNVEIKGKKLSYSKDGKAKEVPMNDWVELGILNSNGEQVGSQKVKVKTGKNNIHFTSGRRPASLMLNPNFDLQEKEYNKDLLKKDAIGS